MYQSSYEFKSNCKCRARTGLSYKLSGDVLT
jgi:hypothetical protein